MCRKEGQSGLVCDGCSSKDDTDERERTSGQVYLTTETDGMLKIDLEEGNQ